MTSHKTNQSKQEAACDRLLAESSGIRFEDFEVHGIIRRRYSIPVPDEQAEYWTIIAYMSGKRVCGIGRFATRAEAEDFCRGLKRWPPERKPNQRR